MTTDKELRAELDGKIQKHKAERRQVLRELFAGGLVLGAFGLIAPHIEFLNQDPKSASETAVFAVIGITLGAIASGSALYIAGQQSGAITELEAQMPELDPLGPELKALQQATDGSGISASFNAEITVESIPTSGVQDQLISFETE